MSAIKKFIVKSPTFICVIEWLILIILYQFTMLEFQQLNVKFYVILATFLASMMCGEFCGARMPAVKMLPNTKISSSYLYLIAFLALSYSLFLVIKISSEVGFESALDFRDTLFYTSDSEKKSLEVGVSIPLVAAAFVCARAESLNIKMYGFAFALFLLAVLSTTKFYLFLSVFFMLPDLNKIKIRHVVITLIIVVLMFSLSHLILEKFSSDPEDGIYSALLKTFEVYLLSGIAAFQVVLDGKMNLPEFRSLYGLNQILPAKLAGVPNSNILPFVTIETGWATNVYTGFQSWWSDFGLIGISFVSFLIGFIYKIIWSSKNIAGIFLTKYSIMPLILVFFDDFFLVSLKTWVMFVLVAMIIAITDVKLATRRAV